MKKLIGRKNFAEKLRIIKEKPVLSLTFGERIILTRTEMNLSQAQLADMVNIGYTSINNYENDMRKPDCAILLEIAKALEVSTDYLLGLTGTKSPDMDTRIISEKTGLSEKAIQLLEEHYRIYVDMSADEIKKREDLRNTFNLMIESERFFDVISLILNYHLEPDTDGKYHLLYKTNLEKELKEKTKDSYVITSRSFIKQSLLPVAHDMLLEILKSLPIKKY